MYGRWILGSGHPKNTKFTLLYYFVHTMFVQLFKRESYGRGLQQEPGFDCLYYFVRKTDMTMEWSTRAFRTVSYFTTAVEDPFVIEDILRNGAEPDEEPVDEEEEDETMESMLLAGHEDDPDDEGISDDDSDLGLPFGSTGEQFGR